MSRNHAKEYQKAGQVSSLPDPLIQRQDQVLPAHDRRNSFAALILTFAIGSAAIVYGFFVLSYLSWCSPGCDSTAVMIEVAMAAGALAGMTGTAATVIKLIRRRRAFPVAAGTLITCLAIIVAGGTVYFLSA